MQTATSDDGLQLVDMELTDAPALHRIYGDPLTTKFLSFTPRSFEQALALVQSAVDDQRVLPRMTYFQLAQVAHDTVGVGRLQHQLVWPGSRIDADVAATIGLAVRSDRVGRGLGGQILDKLVQLTWQTRGETQLLWGAVDPENIASGALMRSRGFELVERVPDHVRRQGVMRPSDVYVLRRPR